MSPVSAISASVGALSASAVVYLPTFLSLQSDLLIYSQFANGNPPGSVDFKDLAYSIQTRDMAEAQTALARLRLDSETAGSPSLIANTAAEPANSTVPDADVAPPANGNLLDATA